MSHPLLPVSRTALGVALLRAMETQAPERLFADPYAGAFLEAGKALSAQPEDPVVVSRGSLFYSQIVIRTRFFDDYLISAVAAGCTQVVLLAAGLDSRAFRLDWPTGTRLFELELPGVLEFKDRVLAEQGAMPRCIRVPVFADLREDWGATLRGQGFDPTKPTVWLAEGLMYYLSQTDASAMLATVGELSAPGSRIAFDRGNDSARSSAIVAKMHAERPDIAALWQKGLGRDEDGWLAERGWRATVHSQPPLSALRAIDDGWDEPHEFVTATRS